MVELRNIPSDLSEVVADYLGHLPRPAIEPVQALDGQFPPGTAHLGRNGAVSIGFTRQIVYDFELLGTVLTGGVEYRVIRSLKDTIEKGNYQSAFSSYLLYGNSMITNGQLCRNWYNALEKEFGPRFLRELLPLHDAMRDSMQRLKPGIPKRHYLAVQYVPFEIIRG